MSTFKTQLRDKDFGLGLVLLSLSLFFFALPSFVEIDPNTYFNLFIPCYFITAVYFIILLAKGRLRRGRDGLFPLFLFLIMFLVSAYALNREMTIFAKNTEWFTVLLIICCLNYIVAAFFDALPQLLRQLIGFVLGISIVLFTYLSFYLFPFYVVSAVAAIALGISLHSFVPLLFTIYTIVLARRINRNGKRYWVSFGAGATVCIVVIVTFVTQWNIATNRINTVYKENSLRDTEGLPAWVSVAQEIPQNGIAGKILRSELVYGISEMDLDNSFMGLPERNFGDQTIHDPLVMIASLFSRPLNINSDERAKVLEGLFDARHEEEDRLWSGDNLVTEFVSTAVRFWPQYYLTYTEKVITVTHNAMANRWSRQEEAFYTFYLPEGAVVTSLSLWIEGKESKAVLSTKEKADSAYKTIVGRERRDPSLVHWQEGNRVSVRVFPVLQGQSRKFKIGITAPLNRENGKLIYRNIYFKGPDQQSAEEEITLDFQQPARDYIFPASFISSGEQKFKHKGKYKPDWKLSMGEQPLSTGSFSFDGRSYSIKPYEKQEAPININAVYLDINNAWTQEEIEKVFNLVSSKKVFVYDGGLVEVNKGNRFELLDQMRKKQFSLFPFFLIDDLNNSLVISKSESLTPELSDLDGSNFLKSLKTKLSSQEKIRLFNLGNKLTPYLKTLKEYRTFQYEQGNLESLSRLMATGMFAIDQENSDRVVIDNAGLAILKSEGDQSSTAPDHLMRLFAYNQIMRGIGKDLLLKKEIKDELVDEASRAYVVTPVSSLVVLETQQDYDRFNIHDNANINSLKNASLASKGAVPEPHEWALIIIAVGFIVWLKFKPVLFKKASVD